MGGDISADIWGDVAWLSRTEPVGVRENGRGRARVS